MTTAQYWRMVEDERRGAMYWQSLRNFSIEDREDAYMQASMNTFRMLDNIHPRGVKHYLITAYKRALIDISRRPKALEIDAMSYAMIGGKTHTHLSCGYTAYGMTGQSHSELAHQIPGKDYAGLLPLQLTVRHALSGMREDYQEILAYDANDYEGLEAATALGLTRPAYKSKLYRARRDLEARLESDPRIS